MTGSTKNTCTPPALLLILLSCFCLSAFAADAVPAAEDIDRLAETAKTAFRTFVSWSFRIRMACQWRGDLLNRQDKQRLYNLAETARQQFTQIEESQRTLKKQIEDYHGSDWEERYGSTGLWRKLTADLLRTTLSKLEIDYYFALASDQPQRNQILNRIVTQIDSLATNPIPAYALLIKAKALALLAQTDPALVPAAANEFDRLMLRSDMSRPTAFKVAIEKIKFLGPETSARLDTLADDLACSQSTDDIELVLSLASLQRRYAPQALEKTLSLWPNIETLLAQLILSDLSDAAEQNDADQTDFSHVIPIEAELAAKAACLDETQKYRAILEGIVATEKFQTPAVLYAAAAAFSSIEPEKAIELLIKASGLQQRHKSDRLDIEPGQIAEEAAQLAYELFEQSADNCPLAVTAFDNYTEIAADNIDPRLEYLHTVVLDACGYAESAEKLLQKIADRPAGPERNRARLVLIKHKLNRQNSPVQQNAILEQLRSLILDCNCPPADTECILVRDEAVYLYCRTLLDTQDTSSAQKVLDLLDNPRIGRLVMFDLFKSQALRRLGRLDQAVRLMTAATDDHPDLSLAPEVVALLSDVLDNIELPRGRTADAGRMLHNCTHLAEFAHKSLNNPQTALLLAEINLCESARHENKLTEIETTLKTFENRNNLNWLRCKAQLLTARAEYEQAAQLWAQIAQFRRSGSPSPSRPTWQWWRAKYYELYCLAQPLNAEKRNLLHTIDVLENTFTHIPPPWAEKLRLLKQRLAN